MRINKTALVYDYGNYVEIARRLARDFKKVLYYCQWKESYPTTNKFLIGSGFNDIIKVENFWDAVEQADVICFFDIIDSDIQRHLLKMGKKVWGSFGSDTLELDRFKTKQYLLKQKLPMNKTYRIKGMDRLNNFLKSNNEKFIKIDKFRGEMETFHHTNFESSKPFLDDLATQLGAKQSTLEFIVEEPVEGVEIGYDGYVIDGKFPNTAMWGIESKDKAYIGRSSTFEELPLQLKAVNQSVRGVFASYKSKQFFCSEVRIGQDKKPYVLDLTVRAGSPPNEMQQETITNLSDIIWYGANGIITEPKIPYKYVCQMNLTSEWAENRWLEVKIGKGNEIDVKLKNSCLIDGHRYVVPTGDKIIGASVGFGKTIDEAISRCVMYAKSVQAFQLEFDINAFKELRKETEKLKLIGVQF